VTDGPATPAQDPAAGDRTSLWLPLLLRLTAEVPSWLVWKNAESAFTGTGDIDAAAPPSAWPAIETTFRQWAMGAGLGPVVTCRHIPGGLNLIALPAGSSTFLEMGVKARRIWRGSTLFVLEDLERMTVTDPLGFRRLRPGAEGLFKLLLNGTRRGGAPNEEGLASKHVRTLLRADPDGVREAAKILGPARRAAIVGARAAAADGWSRPAMLAVEGWAVAQAAVHPRVTWSRIRFRVSGRATCGVVEAILGQGRHIPDDREAWIARLARDHVIYDEAASSAISVGETLPDA
jgi:hypothetical protein